MIDALPVLGVGVVLPLALGGPFRAWAVATAGVALALALPEGGQLRRSVAQLGSGRATFRATGDGLRRWAPHAAFGARVHPPDAPIEAGATVLVVLSFGPFEVVAPNRIVEVVDDPQAFGFAYGTLPGHPECGEESFLVRIDDEGSVTASVTIDAAAGTWLTRMAGPLGRAVQDLAVRRYLAGIASAARAGSG